MIQCVSLSRFVANMSAAVLGVNIYNQDIVFRKVDDGHSLFYDHGAGYYYLVENGLSVVDSTTVKSMNDFLMDFTIDKSIHMAQESPYDLIASAMKDSYTMGYFYFLIPKQILTLALKKRSFVNSLHGTFVGTCKLKSGSTVNTFRDPDDVIKFEKSKDYDFIAYLDGVRCFIFIRTDDEYDLLLKLDNPWQFNKYFAVKKRGGIYNEYVRQ